jgi:Protein of unknown function (DUF3551)
MRALCWAILAITTILAVAPATAQRYDPRYPVCRQVWRRGGVTWFDCSYTSWDQCEMEAAPSQGMCLLNPDWSKSHQGSPGRHRRHGEG